MIANLRERFVPAAVDQHVHRRLRDAEGELFASVLKQAGRDLGGRSQGVYIFSPAGQLLAFSNTADADHVKRLMTEALETFQPAPSPSPSTTPKPGQHPDARPKDVLVALVTSKVLGGYEGVTAPRTGIHAASLGQDHLWIRPDEAAALTTGSVPDSLLKRLVRFHLIDNTRGEPPFWGTDEVRKASLTIGADGVVHGEVELRSTDGSRGYQASLYGHLAHEAGRLTRLDLVAHGTYRGEGRYTRGAPPEPFPFAVAVRLIDPRRPVDEVVPGAARGNVAGYLR